MTSSAARELSASDSSELDSALPHSVRVTPAVELSCDITGPLSRSMRTYVSSLQVDWVQSTSSRAGSPANSPAPPPVAATSPETCGPNSGAWSQNADPIGWRLRTSLESDMAALTGCPVISRTQATPSGRSIWILRYHRGSVAGFASSGWPTPTETANHDAPSMRKWPAYARYQDAVQRTTVRLWEWMMDFPAGWLDCMRSETPSRRRLPSSSGEP